MELKEIRPPNSLFLVRDADSFDVPNWSGLRQVEGTESCLAIGTLAKPDGTTTISLGRRDETATIKAFDGELGVPSRRVVVTTVPEDVLLEQRVPANRARIRVHVNDLVEPDAIVIDVFPALT